MYLNTNSGHAFTHLSLFIRHKAQLKFLWVISILSTVAGKVLTGIVIGGILMVLALVTGKLCFYSYINIVLSTVVVHI